MDTLYKALPDCWTTWDNKHFPDAGQIRRISVWEEYPREKQVATISDPDRIAEVIACLEQYVGQPVGNRLRRDWKSVPEAGLWIDLQGRSRRLCRVRLADGYSGYQSGSGCYANHTMSDSETEQILDSLGLDATRLGWNSPGPANTEEP